MDTADQYRERVNKVLAEGLAFNERIQAALSDCIARWEALNAEEEKSKRGGR